MPDWRKAEDYAFTEHLGRDGWAWEFLRRNPEYRRDWNDALHETGINEADASQRDFVLRDRERSRKWCRDNLINPGVDSPLYLPFQRIIEHRPDLRSAVCTNGNIHPFASLYTEVFNLARPLPIQLEEAHKRLTHEQEWLRLLGVTVALRERRAKPLTVTMNESGMVAIVFDLTHSIRQQKIAALRLLSKYHAEGAVARFQRANWPRYLRVLDAIAGCATNREMGAILFPECDTDPRHRDIRVRDTKKAAKRMSTEGFKHILCLPFKSPHAEAQ